MQLSSLTSILSAALSAFSDESTSNSDTNHFQVQLNINNEQDPLIVFQHYNDNGNTQSFEAFLARGAFAATLEANFQCCEGDCPPDAAQTDVSICMTDSAQNILVVQEEEPDNYQLVDSGEGDIGLTMSWDSSGENVQFFLNSIESWPYCTVEGNFLGGVNALYAFGFNGIGAGGNCSEVGSWYISWTH